MNEPAAAPAFDTLKEARTLTDAGVDKGTAEEIVAFTGRAMSSLAMKTDLASLRGEMKADLAEVRTEIAEARGEMKADIASLRGEVKADIAEVRTEIAEARGEVKADIAEVRTEMAKFREQISRELRSEIGNLHVVIGEMRAEIGWANWRFLGAVTGIAVVVSVFVRTLPLGTLTP